MDEVFGASNFVAPIAFSRQKQFSGFLPSVGDLSLVKDKAAKYFQLNLEKDRRLGAGHDMG